jgi:hypothetical protein
VDIIQKGDEGTTDTVVSDGANQDTIPADVSLACDKDEDCDIAAGLSQGLSEGCFEVACVENECAVTGQTGIGCDDGDGCTIEDTCSEGVCAGSPLVCDDGDPCNGVESCDGSGCTKGDSEVLDDGAACEVQSGTVATVSFCYARQCIGLYRTDLNVDCTIGATTQGPSGGIYISGVGATTSNQFFDFSFCDDSGTNCSPQKNVCGISETGQVFSTGDIQPIVFPPGDGSTWFVNDMDGNWIVGDLGIIGTVSGGVTDWNPPLRAAILQDNDPTQINPKAVSVIPFAPSGQHVAIVGTRQLNDQASSMVELCSTTTGTCNSTNPNGINFTSQMQAVSLVPCEDLSNPMCNAGLKAMWLVYEDNSTLGVAYGDYLHPSGLLIPLSVYTKSDTSATDIQTAIVNDEFWAVGGSGLFLRCSLDFNGDAGCVSLHPWKNGDQIYFKGIWRSPQSVFILMERFVDGLYQQTLAILPDGKSPIDPASYHLYVVEGDPDPELISSGFHQLSGSPSVGPILYGSTNNNGDQKIRVEAPQILAP